MTTQHTPTPLEAARAAIQAYVDEYADSDDLTVADVVEETLTCNLEQRSAFLKIGHEVLDLMRQDYSESEIKSALHTIAKAEGK